MGVFGSVANWMQMKNIRFSINNKILAGFLLLIIIFSANAIFSLVTLNKNNRTVKQTTEQIFPSMSTIKDFTLLVTRSKMLITNWVYLQTNTEDKEALKTLHNYEYPELKEKILRLSSKWESEEQKKAIIDQF